MSGVDIAVARQSRDPAPSDDRAEEVGALAALLAEVVALAGKRAVFPGRLVAVAELAMGHSSVCEALAAIGDDGYE